MLRTIKPKTARGKRALKAKEPKVVENVKTAMFLKSAKSSQQVNDIMKDLSALKKPYSVNMSRKNDLHPFDDEQALQFFTQKNDTALFGVGSHSKKRPHCLTVGRMFDGHVLDMMELKMSNIKTMAEFKSIGCGIGQKPMIMFSGSQFETMPDYQLLKSVLLDFFRGDELKEIALNGGLEHVISVTALPEENQFAFRCYNVMLKKSGTRTPRVELEEMGPRFDFSLGRIKQHDDDMWKKAMRKPKEIAPSKTKNVSKDDIGDTFGRVHVGRQDLSQLQTRKMKGLKRSLDNDDDESNSDQEESDEN